MNVMALVALGCAVRELRRDRQLSVREVAALIPLAVWKLRAIEGGRLDPDFKLLLSLCRPLRVRPVELVTRVERLIATGTEE